MKVILYSILSLGLLAGGAFAQNGSDTQDKLVLQMSKQADAFRKVIASLESDASVVGSELERARSELETVQAAVKDMGIRLETLRTDESELTEKIEAANGQIKLLSSEKESFRSEIEKLQTVARDLKKENSSARIGFERQSEDAQSLLQKLTLKKDTIEKEVALALKNSEAEKNTLAALEAERKKLNVEISERLATRDELIENEEKKRSAIEAIDAETALIGEELKKLQAQKLSEENALAKFKKEVVATRDRIDQLNADALVALANANDARDRAIAETEMARVELEAIQTQTQDEVQATIAQTVTSQIKDESVDLAKVKDALRVAPGLTTATNTQIAELEGLLIDGVCAPEALKTIFGSTNRQTLVSLFRDLGRC